MQELNYGENICFKTKQILGTWCIKLGRGAKLKSSTIQKVITTPGLMLIIGVLNNIIGPLLAASENNDDDDRACYVE